MKNCSYLLLLLIFFCCCERKTGQSTTPEATNKDSIPEAQPEIKADTISPEDIIITKELLFDKYTLPDEYYYYKSKKDSIDRKFQWDKIKERLALLENIQTQSITWAVLQNYKNMNGISPTPPDELIRRNAYENITDTFNVERRQSVALFTVEDTAFVRYGRDGSLVKLLNPEDTTSLYYQVETIMFEGEWLVTKKYVKSISDTIRFNHAIFVDVGNQHIVTLEKKEAKEWIVRSMNPATTGQYKPPYAYRTPTGIFMIQEKKRKMIYNQDGSDEIGGFAPYASRFTNGAYIHGIPTVHPSTKEIEYGSSLGTTPKSHMCVRNASSHARFVYEQMPTLATIVFIID